MTFESAQTNYEGQKGWNDIAPEALDLALAAKSRGKVRPRRVATPIHGLEIPEMNRPSIVSKPPTSRTMLPPPPLAHPSTSNAPPTANSKSTPPAAAPTVVNSRPPPVGSATFDSRPPPTPTSTPPPPLASITANLSLPSPPVSTAAADSSPLSSPTTTGSESDLSRLKELYGRLLQAPTRLSESEKQSCIQKFDQQLSKLPPNHLTFIQMVLETALSNKHEAKQMLVQYGLQNCNVSSWTVPLRRLVDQQL